MNSKEYWNNNYLSYWKDKVDEANKDNGIYINSGDVKTSGDNILKLLIDELNIEDGSSVLDLGCEFCRAYPLLNEQSKYYGCDISEEMIHEAKNNFPELIDKLTVSEVETLPYGDNYFDVCLCFGVFDALYQEEALMEMLRVLKINGKILLTGKNTSYKLDNDKAYIAEIRAREKMHPNYFTDERKCRSS